VGASWGDERLPERFWAKVAPCPMSGCWLWTAATHPRGYGTFGWGSGSKTVRVHRLAYEALVSPIPEGLHIDHLCRVRCCVNPAHLEPVTNDENHKRGLHANKTHCKYGHEYNEANTIRYRGSRACRECRRTKDRQRKRTRRQKK
jgi:hypothetical protein